MAEDKRIRVTTDTSPLRALRQDAQELWNDLTKMEGNFKNFAEETLKVIQEQINLLKSRNELFQTFDRLGSPQTGSQSEGYGLRQQPNTRLNQNGQIELVDPYTGRTISSQQSPGQASRQVNASVVERQASSMTSILQQVTRIADLLEKEGRDEENGVIPPQGQTPDPSKPDDPRKPLPPEHKPNENDGFGIFSGKGFKFPTSVQGLISMLPFGALIAGIGTIIGQQARYNAMQVGATNAFQRENNVGRHWLLNALTFGYTGAQSDIAETYRMAAAQNDRALAEYSSLHRVSYGDAIRFQLNPYYGGSMVAYAPEAEGDVNMNDVAQREAWIQTSGKSAGAIKEREERKSIASESLRGTIGHEATNLSQQSIPETATDVNNVETQSLGDTKGGRYIRDVNKFENRGHELSPTAVLGLNMTDYITKLVQLQRAGAHSYNTRDADTLMYAQRIRGLSDEDLSGVLRTTRFGRGRASASNVISAFDDTLSGMYRDTNGNVDQQYVASVLPEVLQSYNKLSSSVLERNGLTFKPDQILRSMTSIMRATGMEGRQLERVTNALSGNEVSQDDVTQALLLRTARDISGGEGNLSDLQAMIDEMPQNVDLQMKFFDRIKQMTGGGEMMRQVMKAVFPNLTMRDIIDLEGKTGMDARKIFEKGTTSGKGYSAAEARTMVGENERSEAGTINKKIIEGINQNLEAINFSLERLMKGENPPIVVTFKRFDMSVGWGLQ